MKKIIVIGSGGSGKSIFSEQLGKILDIEVTHLDRLYWRPNWVETPKAEWETTVNDLVKRDSWIIDGNFGGTRPVRLEACDTVVFLDLPRWLCIYRVLKRTFLYYGRTRPDMAAGCDERFDLKFLLWVWNYKYNGRKTIHRELERISNKSIFIFRNRSMVNGFLEKCNKEKRS